MIFHVLTSFTVCHSVDDNLSSTEFQTLLIWPWMYSNSSFWYVLVSSLRAFLSSGTLAFVGLHFWIRILFKLSHFFLVTSDSHEILHLALGLIGMHSAAASIWAITKISNSSFGVCGSDVSWSVSNLFYTVNIYSLLIFLLESENLLQCVVLTVSYFYIDLGVYFYWDDSVIGIYSFKRGVCLIVHRIIYPLLVYKCIISLCFTVIWVGLGL